MKKLLNSEIFRFVIVGIIATVVDLALNYLFVFILKEMNSSLKLVICTFAGFLGGVITNYIFSITWVFQDASDASKEGAKKTKGFIVFFILSAIGLFLGMFLMWIFNLLSNSILSIDLYTWEPESINGILSTLGTILGDLGFWLFTIAFCVKTLVVLIYNYISRKKLIFKK